MSIDCYSAINSSGGTYVEVIFRGFHDKLLVFTDASRGVAKIVDWYLHQPMSRPETVSTAYRECSDAVGAAEILMKDDDGGKNAFVRGYEGVNRVVCSKPLELNGYTSRVEVHFDGGRERRAFIFDHTGSEAAEVTLSAGGAIR